MSEFTEAAKSGKLLRAALHGFMADAKDSLVSSRLMKTMFGIVKLDATNQRGLRKVGTAIALPTAMDMLQGFNFNLHSSITSVLLANYVLNMGTGAISFASINPATDIVPPAGATNFSLQAVWGRVDFVGRVFNVQASAVFDVALTGAAAPVVLTPTTPPMGAGTNVYLLLIKFYQLVNLVEYPLHGGNFNALGIVGVA
ncbi:MAG: hypothetical protein ACYDCN_13820 [Bacteroidia bacterium]